LIVLEHLIKDLRSNKEVANLIRNAPL